jgi:2-polyprenyl-3-methyl-5-hydroxy-6-metoxy-1,4-benzoquinol methylase
MDNTKYYEKFNWESAHLSTRLKEKIEMIISSIPNDVNSILDVGCGDGTISEALNNKFSVIASDRSINAVKHVKTKRLANSADLIGLKNNSVDLVFSSEMIEHLPDEIFYSAIKEFKRVSRKYIFLTFPNNENIEKQKTQCSECNFVFNKSYHLRSLNSEIIKKIFPEYKIINEFTTGIKIREYNNFLSKIKHKFSPSISWIPYYWTKGDEALRSTMCPNCGHTFQIPYKFHPIASICDGLNILVSKKIPYQLCILLEKK